MSHLGFVMLTVSLFFYRLFYCNQTTAYEMRISDWSSDVCSSDHAQRTLALLHVGLDDIAAVAHALVPYLAFGQFLDHELALGARDHVLPEALACLLVEVLVTPDIAAFEHRGADRPVRFRHPHHIVERTADRKSVV